MRPELAGGALLDIGVYGLNFALMHFGTDIERMESSVRMTDTGVDAMESITLFFKDGRMAVLTHDIYSRSDRKGIFYGEKGYIVVENINNPRSIAVYDAEDRLLKQMDVPEQISGYEYEVRECIEAIRAGAKESSSMPLSDSVLVMEIMDRLRKQWGMVYPREERNNRRMEHFLFDLDGTLLPMKQEEFVKFYLPLLAARFQGRGIAPDKLIGAVWNGFGAMVMNDGRASNEEVFWNCFSGELGIRRSEVEEDVLDFYGNDFNQAIRTTSPDPVANEIVKYLKSRGKKVYLATNPVFPRCATMNRIRWAGLDAEDFELITTYETLPLQ